MKDAPPDIQQHSLLIHQIHPSFHALKAAKSFCKGEVLIDLSSAERFETPNYATIDLHDRHVIHPVARYMNHSCEPTTYVDVRRKAIVALKAIHPGDEITFDYMSSEREIVSPFDCHCGSSNCVGRVELKNVPA